jgi:hypothetical protein
MNRLPARIWWTLFRHHPLRTLGMSLDGIWGAIEVRLFPRWNRIHNIRAMRQVHPKTRKYIRAMVRAR